MKILYRLISLALCLVTVTALSAVCAGAAGKDSFADVPASHWASGFVESCSQKGIVSGVGGGRFDPDGKVTYAQFAVMVSKAFYPEQVSSITGSPWYAPYMQILRGAGLFEGMEPATSDALADQPMTRFEMVQVSSNLLQTVGKGADSSDELSIRQQITDWDSVPEARKFAVISCYKHDILGGYTDKRFGGGDTMTRAQACVVLQKLDSALDGSTQQPAERY